MEERKTMVERSQDLEREKEKVIPKLQTDFFTAKKQWDEINVHWIEAGNKLRDVESKLSSESRRIGKEILVLKNKLRESSSVLFQDFRKELQQIEDDARKKISVERMPDKVTGVTRVKTNSAFINRAIEEVQSAIKQLEELKLEILSDPELKDRFLKIKTNLDETVKKLLSHPPEFKR